MVKDDPEAISQAGRINPPNAVMMALSVTVKTIPIRLTAAIITFISITTGETTRPILPMMPINSRAPGTGGQPLKPVGNNTASLYATAPCIEVSHQR